MLVFIDESGSPSPADDRKFFVVAALVTESSRAIELLVKHTRRAMRHRAPSGELKASKSLPIVIERFLNALSQESCEIYALVVNKQGLEEKSAERVYRAAIGQLILLCARNYPDLHVYLDKRYTNHEQRVKLEYVIRQTIAHISNQVIVIEQVDSTNHPGLQAVDFVAWAIAHKHENGESWATDIISPLIIVEEVLKGIKIAALPGGR